MAEDSPAVGIDLGTCFSSVAVLHHGQVEIIPNEFGIRMTPSCVAFSDTEHSVGEAAKVSLSGNPACSSASNAKRLIGRPFEDPVVQAEVKYSASQIINDGGKPKFQTGSKGYSPEEIIPMILQKMKGTAETHLGKSITNAVITVPSYFNDSQRRSVIDAGKTAKLNVLRVINESMAVAIAYDYKFKKGGERKVLVFELGGASFNVSIIEMKDGNIFNVKSTAGEPNLGGEEIDNRLVDHFAKEFKKKHKKDVFTNKIALSRLRSACEQAKRLLSSRSSTTKTIISLMDGIDFELTITRSQFEELNEDLFLKFMAKVEEVIKDAKILESSIDDIYLSGGSTRIPKLQELLQDLFYGRSLNKSIHLEEVVAYGAAIQAGILQEKKSEIIKDLLLPEKTKSTGISIKITKQDSGANQADILFQVSKEKNLLDKFTLKGIPLAPSKSVKVEVSVDIDDEEVLSVSGKEVTSGIGNEIKIPKDGYQLDMARAVLESFCVDVKSKAEMAGKMDLVAKCDETIKWLSNKEHQLTCGKEDYESKKKEIERLVAEADAMAEQKSVTPSKKRALKVTARKSTGGGKFPRLVLPSPAKEEKGEMSKQKVTARKSFGAGRVAGKAADPPKKADEDDDPDSSEAIAVITL